MIYARSFRASKAMGKGAREQVIADFGQQWTTYTGNEGYYGSLELFRDIVEPLVTIEAFRGQQIADIGSGTGRIVTMLCEAGAAHVTAIEPSSAYNVLRRNTARFGERVTCLNMGGEDIPNGEFDIIFSYGVLHHVPDPLPIMSAAFAALRPGGKMIIWVYGREGNNAYLAFALPLRMLTRRLPHWANVGLAWMLDMPLVAYIWFARYVRLPLHRYMNDFMAKLTPDKRRLVIYDQLNPEWAKYYRRDEVEELFYRAGFDEVRLHHRGGYSWTAVGVKPAS